MGIAVAIIAYAILLTDLKRVLIKMKLLHKTNRRVLTNGFLILALLVSGVAGSVFSSKQANAFGEITIPRPTVTINDVTESDFKATVTVTDTGSESITDLYYNFEVFDENGVSISGIGGSFSDSEFTDTFIFDPLLFRGTTYTYELRLSSFVTGDFSEYVRGTMVTPGVKNPEIATVSFADLDSKRAMNVTGADFHDAIPTSYTGAVGQLNGIDLFVCAAYVGYGGGLTVQELQDNYGVDTTYITDDAPCVAMFGSQDRYFTDTRMTIVLPNNFDESALGTVKVSNTPLFVYNQLSSPEQQPSPTVGSNGTNVLPPNTGITPVSPIAWAFIKIPR